MQISEKEKQIYNNDANMIYTMLKANNTSLPFEIIHHYYALGRIFGYPYCCIKTFILDIAYLKRYNELNRTSIREEFAMGGYIPCQQHAAYIQRNGEKLILNDINKMRKFPYPFPFDGDQVSELIKILNPNTITVTNNEESI